MTATTNVVKVSFDNPLGTVKPMHAVNNGPCIARASQQRQNFETYRALKIPYARNHDANHNPSYGGPHTVDVHAIFPNFDADENDPANYDFICTDKYTREIFEAGTKVFYRLGASIEHMIKKYYVLPPKDFAKWARICEHIVAHYTEGWAEGFRYDIEYWEIWNEPDLKNGDTWGGTQAQFFDLYEIAAKHLKNRFPNLKIGGPALAYDEDWADAFLEEMRARNVPIDFFSWHIYCVEPAQMVGKAERIRKLLNKHGFTQTESINNEWNYVRGWAEDWIYSLEMMAGMKGAAFTGACMLACQQAPVDMLMYYDARVGCMMNCLFDPRTLRPLKGYYVLDQFSQLYQLGTEVACHAEGECIYALAARNASGQEACMIASYSDDDAGTVKQVKLDLGGGSWEMFLVDEEHSGTSVGIVESTATVQLPNWSTVLFKRI